MEKDLKRIFVEKFGEEATGEYFAPGRINLIGEHTDYNGGYVFPASITIGTYGLAKKREDQKVRLYSENFPEKGIIEFDLSNLDYDKAHDWTNYPKGMVRFLKEAGYPIEQGFEVVYYST